MTASSLIAIAKLIRDEIEQAQGHALNFSRDVQQAEQIARFAGASGDACAIGTAACEASEVVKALAAAVGCLDDSIAGLETASISEANGSTSDEEFTAILYGMKK